jgi:ABC-type amino acid transport substrate-binding protein
VTRSLRLGALAGVLAVGFACSVAGARSLAVIRNLGVLSLCAHANSLPFASKTQDPPGFQIELGRALARRAGREAPGGVGRQRHPVPHRRLRHRPRYHRRARGAGGAPARALEGVSASGVGLAVRPDTPGVGKFEDLVGRRVAVQSGSLAGMLLGQRGARLSAFGFEDDMVEAVIRGEVDAAAVSPATVGYFNLRHPEARLRFVHAYEAEPELRWDLAVGLRRADAPLREAIDGAIDRLMADGTVAGSTPATGSSTVRHSAAEPR